MRLPFNGNFPLTQKFGNKLIINNVDIYAKYGLLGHNGLDYGLPTSTDIVAPHNGKIIEAMFDAGYGNYIKIENDKEGSVLAHLKDFVVKVGDAISEGQLIAHSNNTGNSTGQHLHWGYYLFPRNRQNGYAGFIDQLALIGTGTSTDQQLINQLRIDRDKNWNLYQTQLSENKKLVDRINRIKAITNE